MRRKKKNGNKPIRQSQKTYHSRAASNWWPLVMPPRCKLMWHPLEPERQPIDLALAPADELWTDRERGRERVSETVREREREREKHNHLAANWLQQITKSCPSPGHGGQLACEPAHWFKGDSDAVINPVKCCYFVNGSNGNWYDFNWKWIILLLVAALALAMQCLCGYTHYI